MPHTSPFASRSVLLHLVRGVGAVLCVAAAFMLVQTDHAVSYVGVLIAVVLAFVLLRGCPMCWLIGLFDTIASRSSPRS